MQPSNAQNYSDVWKESEVTDTFNELFPHNDSAEFFQGAAITDGEILIQVDIIYIYSYHSDRIS